MLYAIYKITNLVNDKIYIGKHQTKDLNDGYMGSGKLLNSAIEKYGLENFKKEILFTFDNESDMNAKEAELVTEAFVKEDTNYNLCTGGHGGWGYINKFRLNMTKKQLEAAKRSGVKNGNLHKKRILSDPQYKQNVIETWQKAGTLAAKINNPYGTFYGRSHTNEWKENHSSLMKKKSKGENNSQHGTIWIHNLALKQNKKIQKSDPIPEGWVKGRKMKFD